MFHLSLVSPERTFFSQDVSLATFPGIEGEFGILPQHSPFITSLQEGVVKIYEGQKIIKAFVINGGFIHVRPQETIVLLSEATPLEDLNEEALLEKQRQLLLKEEAA